MCPELLKKLYYLERKKLESLGVYKQEGKLGILRLRRSVLERTENNLSTTEILGRADIAEEVKDDLLRDNEKEDKFRKSLKDALDKELAAIEIEEKEELSNSRCTPEEFAEYLFQSEKVLALEDAISEARMLPEAVFEEQEFIAEKQNGVNTSS